VWNVKAKVITVIIGVTGTNSKSSINYPSKVMGEHEIKELQQRATLVTEHIPQNILIKIQNVFLEKIFTCIMNCICRIAATSFS
jgi:hypothetical protein